MSKKIIGIDLGGTSIKFAILTQEGEIQEKWSIKTNILDEGSHIVDDMIDSIQHRLGLLNLSAENFRRNGRNIQHQRQSTHRHPFSYRRGLDGCQRPNRRNNLW